MSYHRNSLQNNLHFHMHEQKNAVIFSLVMHGMVYCYLACSVFAAAQSTDCCAIDGSIDGAVLSIDAYARLYI